MIVDDALLTYALETEPSPLTVSPPSGAASIGNVTIVASAPPRTSVTVTKMTVMLPVGNPNAPGASDLTDAATGPPTAVYSDETVWTVASTGAGTFDITPPGGSIAFGSGALTITIPAVTVNAIVGSAEILVAEMASSSIAPSQVRHAGIDVAKFPYGFFFDDFTADVAEVVAGGTATLSWVGSSGADYWMYAGSAPRVSVSNLSTWTSPVLFAPTTFILEVSAQEYGQTVTARFNTTVTVSNPTYPSETITGELNAGSLTVSGTTTLAGTSTTTLTAKSVNATSSFAASAATVTIVGGPQALSINAETGTGFVASTDGFVIGWCAASSPGCGIGGTAALTSNNSRGVSFTATGGAAGNTFTMPVATGVEFFLCVVNSPPAEAYTFTFMPFGTGSAQPV